MHDDKSRIELVFNTRKMSVSMVKAELAKRPDLTVDELKSLLANEGGQVRPRKGVERALDARLLAIAEDAIEAASEDMVGEGAPDDAEAETEPSDPIDEMTDDEIARQPGETITEHVYRMAEAQGIESFAIVVTDQGGDTALTIGLDGKLEFADGSAAAQALHGFWVDVMKKWESDEPEDDQSDAPEEAARVAHYEELMESGLSDSEARGTACPEPIAANTPVHVQMTEREVHTGYYVRAQPGAMIRMRDGQDTVIFMPEGSFWVSPPEDGGGD